MLRKLLVPALALVAIPTIASAQFEAGDLELTLSGQGTMTRKSDGGSLGATAGLGYFLTKELEVGVRQNVSFIQDNRKFPGIDNNGWGGRTTGFIDYHFDLGAFQPFVGGQVGYDYPEFKSGETFVAPEVGLKYFVNGTTFLSGSVSYLYFLNDPAQLSFFEGNVGVGFRF